MWTLAFGLAMATPPDILNTQATVLCTGDTHVGMLLASTGNQGNHYIRTTQLQLVRLDVRNGALEAVDHGKDVASSIHFDEPGRGPEHERSFPDDAKPLLQQLHQWGLDHCLEPSPDHGIEARMSTGEDPQLVLTLGDERRVLPAPLYDPRGVFWEAGPQTRAQRVEGLSDETTARAGPLHLLEKHAVVQLRIDSGMDVYDAFAVAERPAYLRAQAFLLNSKGLSHHRDGDHREAARWFATALQQDPTFDTARYNLACATARRGDAAGAVTQLKGLPAEGLTQRVAADTDFDRVRAEPAFVSFLETLAAK